VVSDSHSKLCVGLLYFVFEMFPFSFCCAPFPLCLITTKYKAIALNSISTLSV
jgi:hypothetical protein